MLLPSLQKVADNLCHILTLAPLCLQPGNLISKRQRYLHASAKNSFLLNSFITDDCSASYSVS